MKKLIGMLFIVALVIGTVSAQEISMNYRTQATIATIENDGTDTTVDFFNLDSNAYGSSASDALEFTFATEFAGASITMQPRFAGLLEADVTDDPAGEFDPIELNAYYGWITFGSLNVTAGAFDSRFTSRVSGFAGNYNGIVGEYVKLGGLKDTNLILDADNLGTTNGARIHSLIADYTFNVGDADKLLVKFGVQESDIALNDEGDMNWAPTNISLGYTMDALGSLEGVFRWVDKDVYVFGAYARSNKLVDNLDALLGFTMGMDNSNDALGNLTEMGIDVRAQYTMGPLLLATNMNFTKYDNDEWGMWIAGSANYKFNDWFTGRATVSYIDQNNGDNTINGLLGAEFIATRNCSISTGVEVRYDLEPADPATTVFIPLILRVRF
jgi:hypothetical protein